ncbi:leucyl aminopeptidase family protein [Acuticoccus sp. MNP-M23]|uniref:leucyl aminopeptidase family protein n=1 Tax=Acuticoccus sp. MNP-M23 TaxID=3072793 RepID=UPI0028163969|nr:leucyl aminopeptidase family protein [Acuticoccus sp. MNP-M23]WMS43056.1 leucyl aminopeptidase family protein [Acuticoccus sp. MNP-M23]
MIVGRHEVERSTPVHGVLRKDARAFVDRLSEIHASFARLNGFDGSAGQMVALPDNAGRFAMVLIGLGEHPDPFASAALAKYTDGVFTLGEGWADHTAAALGLLLGLYRFDNYAPGKKRTIKLVAPDTVDIDDVRRIADAVYLTRDLVNTPANDLGPAELADAAQALGRKHGAKIEITDGEELEIGFPMIAAVGAASPRPPLLIDMTWGEEDAPRLTLVGKGVVFDTGGLNIKPGNSMALMKKDMGGAAQALGLAAMVMSAGLPVRLRVLIGAAENAIGGAAFRPGDVLRSRKGLSVEIGNTDAEGRLVLADVLTLADQDEPELLIDFATLTGAARVALGPDLPGLFTRSDALAEDIRLAGEDVHDPVWRLPLWDRYATWLKSPIADINHISSQPFAGASTAALFLDRFVDKAKAYAHFDVYSWNAEERPGRPKGGEAQSIRALYQWLSVRYTA